MDIVRYYQSSSESCSHFLLLCQEKAQYSDANQVDTATNTKELNAVKAVMTTATAEFVRQNDQISEWADKRAKEACLLR